MKISELATKMGLTIKDTIEAAKSAGCTSIKNGSSEIPDALANALLEAHKQISEAVGLPPQLPSVKEVKSGQAEVPPIEEVSSLTIANAKTISEATTASIETIYTLTTNLQKRHQELLFKQGFQTAQREEAVVNLGKATYHLAVHEERLAKLEQSNKELNNQPIAGVAAELGIDLDGLVNRAAAAFSEYEQKHNQAIASAEHLIQTGEVLTDEKGEVIAPDFFTVTLNQYRLPSAISA